MRGFISLELVFNCSFFLYKNINISLTISTFLANIDLWCSRKILLAIEGNYSFTGISAYFVVASYLKNTGRETVEVRLRKD